MVATLFALALVAGCNSPSAPTPPAPPPAPVADPPELTCPSPFTVSAVTSAGATINYGPPDSRKGQGSLTVSCTPATGTTFPVGVTEIACVATDSLNRTASCKFSVTVAAPPRLRASRITAFGDSLTAGATVIGNDPYAVFTRPETAYPTVLSQLLATRYTDQTIAVFNRGLPGEQAARALPRFIATLAGDAPDAVVVQEGYNDYNQTTNDVAGIEGAVRGLSELAAEARRRGVRVFLCTLAPSRPGRVAVPMSAIQFINDRIRVIARAENAVLVDVYSALLPEVNANVSIDGLHLTPLGYQRVAETVFAALRAEFETR